MLLYYVPELFSTLKFIRENFIWGCNYMSEKKYIKIHVVWHLLKIFTNFYSTTGKRHWYRTWSLSNVWYFTKGWKINIFWNWKGRFKTYRIIMLKFKVKIVLTTFSFEWYCRFLGWQLLLKFLPRLLIWTKMDIWLLLRWLLLFLPKSTK